MEIWTGLLGVLIGGLIGNWLAINRDKRKEFNSATKECRTKLLSSIREGNVELAPDAHELNILGEFISTLQVKSYFNTVKDYDSKRNQGHLDSNNNWVVDNQDSLIEQISKLSIYLKRR